MSVHLNGNRNNYKKRKCIFNIWWFQFSSRNVHELKYKKSVLLNRVTSTKQRDENSTSRHCFKLRPVISLTSKLILERVRSTITDNLHSHTSQLSYLDGRRNIVWLGSIIHIRYPNEGDPAEPWVCPSPTDSPEGKVRGEFMIARLRHKFKRQMDSLENRDKLPTRA